MWKGLESVKGRGEVIKLHCIFKNLETYSKKKIILFFIIIILVDRT